MIQYSILISMYSYPCCFHLGSAFIFVCPSLSLFFLPVPISFLPLFTPHLPAHSLSSSLPSSFFLFFSSYPFSFIPFFIVSFYPISFILIFSFVTNPVPTLCSHILSLIPASLSIKFSPPPPPTPITSSDKLQ